MRSPGRAGQPSAGQLPVEQNHRRARRAPCGAGGTGIRAGVLCAAVAVSATAVPATAEVSTPPAAAGDVAQAEGAYTFDIATQPLAGALDAFAAVTGWNIGATAEVTAGAMSPGVSARLAPEEALRRLLAGSGVTYSRTGTSVTLARAATDSRADDGGIDLGPVVVSATRTATPVSQLTRSVTLVDEQDVQRQKRIDRSVGEILSKTVPGFSPSTEGMTDFGQTLRGRNFLTMIDGAPQSTPLRDGRRSLNTIDADAIERIEVVRGGTAAYGFGATGGLVNIITKRPEEGTLKGHSEAGLKLSTTHPEKSWEWHTNHQASGRTGKVDYLLNGTFVQRNSFFDSDGDRIPADPFGVQGGLADTDEYNILGKLGYEPDDEQRFELSLNRFYIRQDTEWGDTVDGDPAAGVKTRAARGNINAEEPGTENTLVNGQYRHEDVNGSEVTTQLYYGDLTTTYGKFPGFDQVEIISEKAGGRLTVDTPVELEAAPFNVIWGLDYLHDETSQPSIDGTTDTPDMAQDAYAGFAELEVPVGAWGLIRGGVRHERISVDVDDVTNSNGTFVNGGTLKFNETLYNLSGTAYVTDNIDVFAGYSQGFSLADIGRAISDTTETEAAALESEAQTVDNYEVGVRGTYDRWDGSVTAFYSTSDNGTSFNQDLEIAKQPERIQGIELAANVDATDKLRLGGTFTVMQGAIDLYGDDDYDEDLPSTRVPPMKVTAYAEYSPYDWWQARLQALYSGNRDPNSTQYGGSEVDDYMVVDLYNRFDVGAGELELGIENLLNADYFPVLNQAAAQSFAYSEGPGRTISATYVLQW